MFDQTLTLNNESQFSVPESNNSSREQTKRIKHCSVTPGNKRMYTCFLRPIYTVRFLLTIVACDFYSAHCSRHEKIVYDFHDIKLPVATIVVGF